MEEAEVLAQGSCSGLDCCCRSCIGSRFLLWFGLLLSQLYWLKVLALVWIAVDADALVLALIGGR